MEQAYSTEVLIKVKIENNLQTLIRRAKALQRSVGDDSIEYDYKENYFFILIKINMKKLTATPRRARYIGTHPHLTGTEGVYFFNKEQDSYVYRPESDGKSDWYRIFIKSLVILDDNDKSSSDNDF